MNLNRTSQSFVGSAPLVGTAFCNSDWFQANQDYYGVESSMCAAYVGTTVGRRGATLDPYGIALTTAVLPGDGWRRMHDSIKWEISSLLSYCFVDYTAEAYGLFSPCIAQQEAFGALPRRTRQGLIPDWRITFPPHPDELNELKCCRGKTWFDSVTVMERCGGVEKRAVAVPREYLRKAIKTSRF